METLNQILDFQITAASTAPTCRSAASSVTVGFITETFSRANPSGTC